MNIAQKLRDIADKLNPSEVETVEPVYTFPENSPNFAQAVAAINSWSWKARKAFYFRLVNGISTNDLHQLQMYINQVTDGDKAETNSEEQASSTVSA